MTPVDMAELISGFLFERPEIEHVTISDHLITAITADRTFNIVVRSKDRENRPEENRGEPASCKKPDVPADRSPRGRNEIVMHFDKMRARVG